MHGSGGGVELQRFIIACKGCNPTHGPSPGAGVQGDSGDVGAGGADFGPKYQAHVSELQRQLDEAHAA